MLENLKEEVVKIAKKAENEGLCKHKSGNFSIRDEKTGYIAVTPSGVSREKLSIEHICIVDMDMNIIEQGEGVRPTSELMMHIASYRIRPSIKAIVHTHSKFATAFSVVNKEIRPIVYEMMNVTGGDGIIRVAPYARPGTKELAENVAGIIAYSDVCLMAHHGAIAVSCDGIEDAYLKASYVEEIAEVYYRAIFLNGGKEPEAISAVELSRWKYPEEIGKSNS